MSCDPKSRNEDILNVGISKEDLSEIVSSTIKEALASERTAFRVPPRQHFLDHEQMHSCKEQMDVWILNHDFITPIRSNVTAVKNSFFKSFLKLLGIGSVLVMAYVYAKIKGIIGQ